MNQQQTAAGVYRSALHCNPSDPELYTRADWVRMGYHVPRKAVPVRRDRYFAGRYGLQWRGLFSPDQVEMRWRA